MGFSFWLALTTLILYLLAAIDVMGGNRRIRSLSSVAPRLPESPPRVSIVVAARNEERKVREAMTSLLALEYPRLELIVVNDRSEDATGAILESLALGDPRLQTVHVEELPAGWLGKNHALWLGSRRAAGELLLFTDADIIMEPSLLARAVTLMGEEEVDHLVVAPKMTMPGTLLSIFGLTFILMFSLFARPWKARDPKSSCHVGIGAFNLVRAAAYHAVGGHGAIPLRPDDDLKLGKILKKHGFSQDVAFGSAFMNVEWYATLGEVIRGLEKNAFAGCDYRLWLVLSGVVVHSLCSLWPYLAIFLASGPTRLLYGAVVLVITLLLADCARFAGTRRRYALGFPIGVALFVWILLRTTFLNLWQGGITWRGTFYSLAELRRNRV